MELMELLVAIERKIQILEELGDGATLLGNQEVIVALEEVIEMSGVDRDEVRDALERATVKSQGERKYRPI